MNKEIKDLYVLIFDNTVLEASTNLMDFHRKIISQDIGFNYSLSTLRKRFLESNRFNHPTNTGRLYWMQKIPNDALP